MPNVGVQTFTAVPGALVAQAGADVSCTAGATTTALSIGGNNTVLTAVNAGQYIGWWCGVIFIDLGATPPSAMLISCATTAGTALQSLTYPVSQLVASAHLAVPISLFGQASSTAWQGGLTPLIQVNPTGQAVTAKLNSLVQFNLVPNN